uniref:Alpha/beta hydrolase fold protein n=1 Tax=Marseillevirus LCMAC201 TaxID=2506605 RepID=A0A481YWU0_9VIRU|nr:MAG: alpha/beta hydrolase fold protein [Marseillevirus LCMAC201]
MYLVLIAVLVIMVTMCVGNHEGLMQSSRLTDKNIIKTPHATVIGGTISTQMQLKDHSTNVRRLLGDTNETIILIHNSPFNLLVWSPLFMYVQSLKSSGKKIPSLICYDLLGHGTAWLPVDKKYNDTNIENHAWEYKLFSDDLYNIYKKHIRSGKVTVVGYGFGGKVAQAFALDHQDLVNALYVLATSIGPTTTGIRDETSYLAQWISKNPLVTYLTMEQQFVQYNLCMWFQNNDKLTCPYPENAADPVNMFGTVEYLLAAKMFRESSCQTYLQVDKLESTDDLRPLWVKAQLTFPVTFLVAGLDHYTNLDTVKQDMEIVQKATPSSTLYVSEGKHGFTLTHPEYIYDLITGQDMSKNLLTIETI